MTPVHRWSACAPLLGLVLMLMSIGCASLRPPPRPAGPPADRLGAAAASRAGFNAIYEGDLRIWFHSIPMIWYVAVPPGATGLSAAVLSPVGIKIMQMHGTRAAHSCVIAVPAASRLQPYGDSLWSALVWALADDLADADLRWTRQGEQVLGNAALGSARVQYEAVADTGVLAGKTVLDGRRRLFDIEFSDGRRDGDRWYPGRIDIRSARPRCRLVLKLRSLRWNDAAGRSADAAGP